MDKFNRMSFKRKIDVIFKNLFLKFEDTIINMLDKVEI